MLANPLQFAVVREDPLIEAEILKFYFPSGPQRVLLIGSGGCSALSLQSMYPELKISLLDFNAYQLRLIQKKVGALAQLSEQKALFNIEDVSSQGLNQCGNFESLFRGLRQFLFEFVVSEKELKNLLESRGRKDLVLNEIFAHKFWPVGFEMFFSDSLLNTMFGEGATQHAPKGSYPLYFRKVIERGLRADAATTNYFLHHILLGYYLDQPECWPLYLRQPALQHHFEYVVGTLDQVADLGAFDLVQLSNIFDWMSDEDVLRTVQILSQGMKKNSVFLLRQLNNEKNYIPFFKDQFEFDVVLAEKLLRSDRSLFYSKINIGVKK